MLRQLDAADAHGGEEEAVAEQAALEGDVAGAVDGGQVGTGAV